MLLDRRKGVVGRIVPSALVVEEAIGALLKLLGDILRLLVALEPGLVLLVESPTLTLERFSGEVLLVRALSIVECVEQCIGFDSRIEPRIIKDRQRLLGVVSWGVWIGVLRPVVMRRFRVC